MDTQTAEIIAARIREVLHREAGSGRPALTLDDIEKISLEIRRKAGQAVAEELTARHEQPCQEGKQDAGKQEAGTVQCRCGRTARSKGSCFHQVVMMTAELRLRRRYYYCRKCDAGFCPADVRLGLSGSAYTGRVQASVRADVV